MMTCSIRGCDAPYLATGYCSTHYARKRQGWPDEDMALPIGTRRPRGRLCQAGGCARPHSAFGYCSMHAQRLRTGVSMDSPVRILRSRADAAPDGHGKRACKHCLSPITTAQMVCASCKRARRHGLLNRLDLERLLEQQAWRCAIGDEPIDIRSAVVDHDHSCCPGDHSCGKCIRGLLCKPCNAGIGMLQDSVDKAVRAALYLWLSA